MLLDPVLQMWFVFGLIGVTLTLYALERLPLEITSLGAISALMIFFHFFPVTGGGGVNLLSPERFLSGFANPALIAVLALLVIGEGMVRTGALDRLAQLVLNIGRPLVAIALSFVLVILISAFLNNTPVVVIFIPIMQALATKIGRSSSALMMPLSFAAIIGGMITLIGSSTNLLVNSALIELGQPAFGFFDFTLPGLAVAAVGFLFLLFVIPRLLPDRAGLAGLLLPGGGKQFVAQITIGPDASLIGETAKGGLFPALPDITVQLIMRGEHGELPPFDNYTISEGDVLVVVATRAALTRVLETDPSLLHPELREREEDEADSEGRWRQGEQTLAEVMVSPSSRMVGRNLEQIGFRYSYHCVVLGIRRRARMIRSRMTNIRLEPGDVLLVQGQPEDVSGLKASRDVVLMEWSQAELPATHRVKRALIIFAAVVGLAATGVVPIVISSLAGAAAMVALDVLNLRQAARSVDGKIVTMIAAALALGVAMQETGGAAFISALLAVGATDASPAIVLSFFFLLVALMSNMLSAKATAVLFTPIAISLANQVGAPVEAFAVAVIFASNCGFASPIGYQTNLMVMGPGHYLFRDFIRAGLPLLIVIWLAFSLTAPFFFDL
ncbi:MAG: SLC13 family permease [Rhodospirillales bacterium]